MQSSVTAVAITIVASVTISVTVVITIAASVTIAMQYSYNNNNTGFCCFLLFQRTTSSSFGMSRASTVGSSVTQTSWKRQRPMGDVSQSPADGSREASDQSAMSLWRRKRPLSWSSAGREDTVTGCQQISNRSGEPFHRTDSPLLAERNPWTWKAISDLTAVTRGGEGVVEHANDSKYSVDKDFSQKRFSYICQVRRLLMGREEIVKSALLISTINIGLQHRPNIHVCSLLYRIFALFYNI